MLGLGIAILAGALLSTCFSVGGSLLIWLVGIPVIALGLEVSVRFARLERWRMTLVDPRPLVAHPYRPLNGLPASPYGPWLRTWAEAEFLDANRWRDVVYILVLVPLAILEFMVSVGLWLLAAALILSPIAFAAIRSADPARFARLQRSPTARLGVARGARDRRHRRARAGAGRGVRLAGPRCASTAPSCRGCCASTPPWPCARTTSGCAAAGRRRSSSRPPSCDGSSATSTTAPSNGSSRWPSTSAAPRSASTRTPSPRRRSSSMPGHRRASPSRSCGTSSGARCPRSSSTAGWSPRWRPSPRAARCRPRSSARSSPASACRRRSSGRPTSWSSRRSRTSPSTAAPGAARWPCGQDPWALVVEVRDDGIGGAIVAQGGGLAGLRDRAQALDGTLHVSSPAGGPTVVRVELPLPAPASPDPA